MPVERNQQVDEPKKWAEYTRTLQEKMRKKNVRRGENEHENRTITQ